VIKHFRLPGKGVGHIFWKALVQIGLSKNIGHTPFLWGPKDFGHHKEGQPKKYERHKVGDQNISIVARLATENFRSPQDW
jgi:hypothetical protein